MVWFLAVLGEKGSVTGPKASNTKLAVGDLLDDSAKRLYN